MDDVGITETDSSTCKGENRLAAVYTAPVESDQPISSPSESHSGNGLTLMVTALLAIAKWTLPAILGTGPIFSLGSWIEEWILVVLLGAFIGAVRERLTLVEPMTYFLIGYVLTMPLYCRDKLVLLVLVFGVVTTWLLVLAIFAVAIGRRMLMHFRRA